VDLSATDNFALSVSWAAYVDHLQTPTSCFISQSIHCHIPFACAAVAFCRCSILAGSVAWFSYPPWTLLDRIPTLSIY
jgi:hypothetical protein